MFKELFHKIFKPKSKPQEIQETEFVMVYVPHLTMADLDNNYEKYTLANIVVIDRQSFLIIDLADKYKSILRQMQLLLSNNIYKVKTHLCSILAYISLLFGLCSTQSAYIFHSFLGSSLGRIPAL
jgi:hypothetical protein